MKKITGTVQFINLEMGFWGIVGKDGSQWRPVNMPNQLKYDGKVITVKAMMLPDDVSFIMWGTPIKIVSFSTIG